MVKDKIQTKPKKRCFLLPHKLGLPPSLRHSLRETRHEQISSSSDGTCCDWR